MMHVEPSFVLYALRLDPGCCLRADTVLSGTVEPHKKILLRAWNKEPPESLHPFPC